MNSYSYYFYPRFSDSDAYNIFHHAAYYYWFEEARFQFSREVLQFDEDIISGKDIKFPVIESYCKYKKAIPFNTIQLEIRLDFSITKSNKIVFEYRVLNGKTLCASGKTVHVFLYQNKLKYEIPAWFLEGIDIE
ncbi:acyl-CoA thioesterase [Paenibacillus crassostreae]|uniref:Thioesterase n=1 Tax=Paenibacillus crassostreae TaxID=1763538 RepID=A0A167FB72_9BACL|nr:thioesterase family protein [Paenibacillus crassostreae]AOZ90860.1 hypothetical protein LPB68_00660 [Paenibacillus crassostreae]OAB76374.1 hypothetical protein PNBC_02875 [Paenibacillus crassostreae]